MSLGAAHFMYYFTSQILKLGRINLENDLQKVLGEVSFCFNFVMFHIQWGFFSPSFSCRFDLLFCCAGNRSLRASVYPSLIKTVSGKMEILDSQTAGSCLMCSYCKCVCAILRPGTRRLSDRDLTENKACFFCPTPPKLQVEQGLQNYTQE